MLPYKRLGLARPTKERDTLQKMPYILPYKREMSYKRERVKKSPTKERCVLQMWWGLPYKGQPPVLQIYCPISRTSPFSSLTKFLSSSYWRRSVHSSVMVM